MNALTVFNICAFLIITRIGTIFFCPWCLFWYFS